MSNMSPEETRILAIERLQVRLDDQVRRIKRDMIASGQEIWDSDVARITVPSPIGSTTITCVSVLPTLNLCLPVVMPFYIATYAGGGGTTPSYVPFGSVTWNGATANDTSGTWTGCMMYNRPASSASFYTSCTARTIPIFFTLVPNLAVPTDPWVFKVEWIGGPYSGSITTYPCPTTGKTCVDYSLVGHTVNGSVSPYDFGDGVTTYFNGAITFPNNTDAIPGLVGADIQMIVNQLYLANPVWLKETIHLVDPMYGAVDLVWDFTSREWQGCIAGISYPGYSTCVARTMAIHYGLDLNSVLRVRYSGAGNCPLASTCATGTNTTLSFDLATYGTENTGPFSLAYTYPGGAVSNFQRLYRNTANTITVTNPY